MGDGTNVEGVFDPLFKITLPGDMEKCAGSPEENDCKMAEVGSENLLIKIFLGHTIMGLKIMGSGNPVPNPTGLSGLGRDPG